MQGSFGWNWLGLGVLDSNVGNDQVCQSSLGEIVGTVPMLLDVDTNIVRRMALVLNVESQALDLLRSGVRDLSRFRDLSRSNETSARILLTS